MEEKLFRILKKVYYKKAYVKDADGYQIKLETGDKFDCDTMTSFYSTDLLSLDELSYLQQSNYPLNDILYDTHDSLVKNLKEILKHKNITFQNVTAAYIRGFCSFPRGRQPIISYMFAASLPMHSYHQPSAGMSNCRICGIKKEFWLERGNEIFRKYWGNSWNEMLENSYLDLEEFKKLPPQMPSQEDLLIFSSVINLIRHAPEDECVSKLEQRIKKAKLIPKCDKYKLRGLLITLSELGVMPNPSILPLYEGFTEFLERCNRISSTHGNPRSDIVLPLGGWRGKYGICEERFQEVFSRFL